MTSPKLSICIATLNRAALIGQTLDSIISQAGEEVEIVIVDGASTDNTEEVVGTYQAGFPHLHYVRLAEKGGVDRDYARSVEHAKGDYCWLMSDDDVLKPGAIAAILRATEQDHDVIIVNSEVRNTDLSQRIGERILPFAADKFYAPGESEGFFRDGGTYMSFIGCVVIRRRLWNTRAKEPYYGSEFIHVGVIFQAPLPGSALAISHPWIMIRYNNASWSSRYFEIWMFKWPRIVWSFDHFSVASRHRVVPKEPWRNVKVLMINRARGAYGMGQYTMFLEPALESRYERLRTKAVAAAPAWLVNLGMTLYFALFKRSDLLTLADFKNSPHYLPRFAHRLVQRLRP